MPECYDLFCFVLQLLSTEQLRCEDGEKGGREYFS